jgi:hypothetical protein
MYGARYTHYTVVVDDIDFLAAADERDWESAESVRLAVHAGRVRLPTGLTINVEKVSLFSNLVFGDTRCTRISEPGKG